MSAFEVKEFKHNNSRFSVVMQNTEEINAEEYGQTGVAVVLYRSKLQGTDFKEDTGKLLKAYDLTIANYRSAEVKVSEVEFHGGYAYLVISVASLVYKDAWAECLAYMQVKLDENRVVDEIHLSDYEGDFHNSDDYKVVDLGNGEKVWSRIKLF